MRQITVNTPSSHYAVAIGRGLLAKAGAMISGLAENTGVFLLSSPRVWRHWGKKLQGGFKRFGGAKKILFDDGEPDKRLAAVEKLCRGLARAGADRGAVLVALGGGVVGDVAGFVASCYLRGVRVVQVPTTLVAQVDAAIGGKTGVNLPEGKNLVGAFHQPRLVVVDPEVLRTLPERQYRAGLYEIIKCGVIADELLFRFLERRLDDLRKQRRVALEWVLTRAVKVKAAVVSEDERESDRRRILNFGHTIGHALEAATKYRRFLHGEAVGWGMIAAARIAVAHGRLDEAAAGRIVHLILRVGPLPPVPKIPPKRLLQLLRADKKTRGGKLHLVLPRRIGQAEIVSDVPEKLVTRVFTSLRNFHTE